MTSLPVGARQQERFVRANEPADIDFFFFYDPNELRLHVVLALSKYENQ